MSPTSLDSAKVLIVDDLEEGRWALSHLIQMAGLVPVAVASGKEALACIREEAPDVLLLDICLPDMDGFEVLTQVKAMERALPIIMVTAYGKTHDAVRAIRAGAYDYLAKPFHNEDVVLTVRRALEERAVKSRVRRARDLAGQPSSLFECMGESQAIQRIVSEVDQVAKTNFSVVMTGETGTGKELVAQAIHAESLRAARAFVAVDCGAIPEPLIESELFGHEKGAFTGAHEAVAGAFELADGGTLFLDEIGNLPLPMQGKLLRVLEERRIHRIGSTKQRAVDFRVVAATNVDLGEMVNQRTFRRDLYHRLAEFTIYLRPLRERKEDLPFLVKRFLELANQELGKEVHGLSAPALGIILAYEWPGNVRELRNQLRRAVLCVSAHQHIITPNHLGIVDRHNIGTGDAMSRETMGLYQLEALGLADFGCQDCPIRASGAFLPDGSLPLKEVVSRVVAGVERAILTQALRQTKGNKAEAARLLGIDYKTIHTKLKGYNLSPNRNRESMPAHQAPSSIPARRIDEG
ncbi:MAG: sigma-54-dependent Fis family transcriptional regulator [Nitrospirae bacterium]|nr:MAG: sigma-54-dependent Fis family transcriptional regulator [Nitrospirota bacterium]